jgi:hypothetical protein
MHKRTIAILVLAVAVLGAVAWWQMRGEARQQQEADVALFEGFDESTVDVIRVENLERDVHMKLERASDGHWRMTDPVDVPADDALAQYVLKIALQRRATPVPSADADAATLGLEPPRVILELQAPAVSGAAGRTKAAVEFGALDLDGRRVNVRARGRLLRTLRDLDTTLARPLEEFKSHRVLAIEPREVVEVHRTGSLVQEGASSATDLSLDAIAEGGAWRATSPVSAALDPLTTSVWVQGVAMLELDKYADQGLRLLADFGLDPPEITIAITTLKEEHKVLRLGRPQHRAGEPWFGTVDGQSFVWFVHPRSVYLLGTPLDGLLDRRLVRLSRDAIDGLRLQADGAEVHVVREGQKWRVSRRAAKETAFSAAEPADKKRVESLLARIESSELAGFLPGAALLSDEVRASIYVESGGERQGGVLGAEHENPSGGRAVRFLRDGDSIVALADPKLFELARTRIEDLWTLQLAEIDELDQHGLLLRGAGNVREYERGSKGLWTPKGLDLEARELRDVLDPLLFPRAGERLTASDLPPLEDPVTVEFTNSMGKKTTFVIGAASDGKGGKSTEIEIDGRRSVLKDQDVHKRLLAILAAK